MGSKHNSKHNEDDVDELYANIMSSSPGEQARNSIFAAARQRAEERRNKREQYHLHQKRLAEAERKRYQQNILGLDSNDYPQKRLGSRLKLPSFDARILLWPVKKIPTKVRWSLLGIVFVPALFILGFKIVYKAPPEPVSKDITPAKVYVPPKLPEGFSTAGSPESLDNGALLYTVYDNKGNTITITQQSRPKNFDTSIFGGAEGINAPLGKAYIVQSKDRMTGYVIAENTMVLFNTKPDIEPQTMYDLMLTFRP